MRIHFDTESGIVKANVKETSIEDYYCIREMLDEAFRKLAGQDEVSLDIDDYLDLMNALNEGKSLTQNSDVNE